MSVRHQFSNQRQNWGALWTPDAETWSRMFKASHLKKEYADALLARMTVAELRLWAELSKENAATRARPRCPWRCQVLIKGWIVDFYNDYRLWAIEVDGPVHQDAEQRAKDAIKDEVLHHFGITVHRVSNAEILRDAATWLHQLYLNP